MEIDMPHASRLALGLALAVLLVGGADADAATRSKDLADTLDTTTLGPHLWRISGGEAGSVLVLDGADGIVLVDTRDSTTAHGLDLALARLSRRRVHTVINTHYHQDHTLGNERFGAGGAEIVAQANVTAQALKDTFVEALGWHRHARHAACLPTRTFTDSLRLSLDGEAIVLYHAPNAHTDGDAIVWLPGRNLVHAGDIVEVGAPPFIDWWAGGTLDGMIAGVDRVMALCDARTVVVPGHGALVDRAWLVGYRAMLVAAGASARAAIARGQSLADYGASKPLLEYAERLGGERLARRLAIQTYYGLNGLGE
jgi:glyoxylase-like metal-dependent hydrolase (beta-lactamase superfamily II)